VDKKHVDIYFKAMKELRKRKNKFTNNMAEVYVFHISSAIF
jgi:hypothetical protein